MRILKHIFKTLLITSTITPFVCSCSMEEESSLQSIEVKLPFKSYSIEEKTQHISEPIQITCLDQKGEPIDAQTEIVLSGPDGSWPEWVRIDGEKILINADVTPGTYQFNIYVKAVENNNIQSDIMNFSIEVYKKPLLPPDSLEISCSTSDPVVFITQTGDINFDVVAHKSGHPDDEVSNICEWSITNISGPFTKDLQENDLFELEYDDESCKLIVSQQIDNTYIDDYILEICATSVLAPNVMDTIQIPIKLVNGLEKSYPDLGVVFTREDFDDPWELSKIMEGETVISTLPSYIYGYPFKYIAPYLCSNSQITKLSTVFLPETVTEIGSHAFYNQTLLYFVEIPGVKVINDSAFENCINMRLYKDAEQPKLNHVGKRAFYKCKNFTLDSENDFMYIGEEAFYYTIITDITLGTNVLFIDINAFSECSKLQNIILLTKIPPKLGGSLYSGITNPQSIKIPTGCQKNYNSDLSWQPYSNKLVEI